ncbi:hypothetical protein H8E77_14060, partial [bacterium]|nr:hypothetical protein [bacterium]
MIAKQTIWIIFYILTSATNLVSGLTLPKVNLFCEDEPRIVKPDEIPREFQREGNALPEKVIKRYAIYDPVKWTTLRKKVDKKSGYQYFQETLEVDKYGKVYLIAILINTPVEVGLQSASKCRHDNYGLGKRTIELNLKGDGKKFRVRGTAGDIL